MQLVPQTEIMQVRKEAEQATPIVHQVESLHIVRAEDYAMADHLLSRLAGMRKVIAERFEHILNPLNIARNSVLALRKELDGPPAMAEALVRDKMKAYKLEEQRSENEERRRIAVEKAKLEQLALEAARKEEEALSQKMKERLAAKRLELEAQVAQKSVEEPVTVRVAGSTSRTVKKVTIDPIAVIKAIASGKIPADVITEKVTDALQSAIAAKYKLAPPLVISWPGVTVEDDVSIVRR